MRPTSPAHPEPAPPRPVRGRAAGLVIAALGLLFAILYLLLPSGGPAGSPADGGSGEAASPASPGAPQISQEDPGRDSTDPRPDPILGPESAQRAPGVLAGATGPASGATHPGRLRGELLIRPGGGVPKPAAWTLVLEPSRVLADAELAIERRVERTLETLTFDEQDLPLGGYDLFAEAEGWNGRRQSVRLTRRASMAYVLLELVPAGTLSGSVNDVSGWPLEHLTVVLAAEQGGFERRTLTAPDGSFAFPELPDGSYVLALGSRVNPLVDPIELAFQTPGFTLEPIEVPRLGAVRLEVLDPFANPVSEARVTGYGDQGGAIDVVTDAFGEAVAFGLTPGRWTFRCRVEEVGARVASFVVPDPPELPEPPPRITLELRGGRQLR